MELSPRERKTLMARTHELEPRVRVGEKGLTEAVISEAEKALSREPLTKVRLPGDRELRHRLAVELAARLGAALVGEIGKIAVLYRPASEAEVEGDGEGDARA